MAGGRRPLVPAAIYRDVVSQHAPAGDADRKALARGDRWARVAVGILALGSVMPIAYYWGTRSRTGWRDLFLDLAFGKDTDVAGRIESGAGAVTFVSAAVGAIAFAILMWLRRRSTRRRLGLQDHQNLRARSQVFTLAAWTVLLIAAALVGTVQVAAGGESSAADAAFVVGQPAYMLLVLPGLALAVAMSNFFHRREYGLTGQESPPVKKAPENFKGGMQAFVWSLVFSTALGLAGLLEALVYGDGPVVADYGAEWLAGVVIVPAIVAGTFLLVLFAFAPLRWMTRAALRKPLTRISLAAIAIALVGDAAGLPALVTGVLILGGGLVGSVTGLYTQDVGAQPWLGFLFMAFSFAFGLTNDAGEVAAPSTWIGWSIATATAAYGLREAVKLWRKRFPRASSPPLAVVPAR